MNLQTQPRLQFALPTRYKDNPLTTPHYAELLLDGERAALIFVGDKGKAYTLRGREIVNAYPVIEELERSDMVENLVLDGEFTGDALGLVMASTQKLEDTYRVVFHAYDIMTLDQWEAKICEMPLHYRKSVLAELVLKGGLQRTLFVPPTFANTLAEAKRAHAKNRQQGFAGSVYKDIESPYPFGHTLDWWVDRT